MGAKGSMGAAGNPGADGSPGNDGAPGAPAIPGPPGPTGRAGTPGAAGLKGDTGVQGIAGIKGIRGPPGPSMSIDDCPLGAKGSKGEPGIPGKAAENIQLNPYIVAFHSQKNQPPKCLEGMTELWTGYSFMFVDAGSDANKWSQNLGVAGSCMRAFRKEFFSECSSEECFRYPESHRTNWLAIAAEPGETDFVDRSLPRRRFKSKSDIDKYLSRCVVCETIFKL